MLADMIAQEGSLIGGLAMFFFANSSLVLSPFITPP